jgi:colanic acid/amylovoran biosynthesis glycosyltransferase
MRVTYFINQYPKVSHTFIRREILALERLGFEVQRIALRGWDEKLLDQEDISEQIKTLYVLKSGVISLFPPVIKVLFSRPKAFFQALVLAIKMGYRADRPLFFHVVYFLEACKLCLEAKKYNSQHIHAHFGTNPSEIAMLASVLGLLPYSFTIHGPEEFDKPQFLKLSEKTIRSKFVVTISSFGRSQLQRWVNFEHWNKIKVVHCGLESGFYNVAEGEMPIKARFICVGRLCEQKGQLLLIEAARILNNHSRDFELVLAGDGEMRTQIETLIIKYQLQDKIKITGWISSDEVRANILNSQVLVLPSFAEGLPVVIMEAMALKRPVISTYVAGIPELVIDGENGWLIPAGSVLELSSAMEEMLAASSQKLKDMGEAAHIRVIERHSIDTEAAKLASLFLESAR